MIYLLINEIVQCTLSLFIVGKSKNLRRCLLFLDTLCIIWDSYLFADIATNMWDSWLLQQNYTRIFIEKFRYNLTSAVDILSQILQSKHSVSEKGSTPSHIYVLKNAKGFIISFIPRWLIMDVLWTFFLT